MEYVIQGYSQVTILEHTTKTPVLFFPEAYFTNIQLESKNKIGSGGQQGLDLIGWGTESEGKFLIYSPIFSMKFLELMSGSDLKNMEYSFIETELQEINNNTITLLNLPDTESDIEVYQLNSSGKQIMGQIIISNIDGKEILLDGNSDGWALIIYRIKEEVEIIDVGKIINKGYYSIVGNVQIYDNISAESQLLRFEFPKVIINNNFNIKVLNSRNPEEIFTLHCHALVEEKIDKSLLRIIKRK
jgi:hypothetical protein